MTEHQKVAAWLLSRLGPLPVQFAEAESAMIARQWLDDIATGKLRFRGSAKRAPE